jgi:hypothetical protein
VFDQNLPRKTLTIDSIKVDLGLDVEAFPRSTCALLFSLPPLSHFFELFLPSQKKSLKQKLDVRPQAMNPSVLFWYTTIV